MSAVNAGRVLIISRGAWNAQTEYQMLDSVRYQGSMYIAKRANQNVTPVDGDDWFLSAEGVASGAFVASFNNRTGDVLPTSGDYDITQIGAENGLEGQVPMVNHDGELELSSLPPSGVIPVNPSVTTGLNIWIEDV